MRRFALLFTFFMLLFFLSFADPTAIAFAAAHLQNLPGGNGDLISPQADSGQCLTVDGYDVTVTPVILLSSCRATPNQYWVYEDGASQWRTTLDTTYCLATVNTTPGASGRLTVRPCTDSRALTILPNPTLTDSYQISGTTYVLDSGVYGYVALAHQNGWSYQYWRWLQADLDVVNAQGCMISYPFAASDTATYAQELACDRVAKIQPPYGMPRPELERRTLFPGMVPTDALTVTRTYPFDLNFKSHSYLRQSATPANWQSTGLYAPPGQILTVTITDATADDLKEVYLRIGVHTDQLSPTASNVSGGDFLRYPNVGVRVKLTPGENLVRSPYGGPIILDSGRVLNKIITVAIANAVEAPYFVAGQTTAAEWLVRRNAPAPYAEVESELAVIHVPATEVRALDYTDMLATADYYSQIGRLHNELSGLSTNDAAIHQPPLGKYRHVEDIQISAGWGHSGFPAMYFTAWQIGVPAESVYRATGWGVWHELGHNYQMPAWSNVYGTEVTVNLWSLYAQEQLFGNSRLVDGNTYAAAIARLNDPAITDKWGSADAFEQLVFLDQLRLAFPALNWKLWTDLIRRYREMDTTSYAALNNDQAKRDRFMTLLCDITQTNLTPHFAAWTLQVSQAAKDTCAGFAPLTQATWLLDGANPMYYAGDGTGAFTREWWSNRSGVTLADFTHAPDYPALPTGSTIVTGSLEGLRDWGDTYGERLRGYLHPPVTGLYEFWLAGDDATQFWLSIDEEPLHASPVLTVATATAYRAFDSMVNAIQRSQPIWLEAGRQYYFEVLHKESSGGDHVAVAWTIPAGENTPVEPRKVIDGRYLSPYFGDLALRKTLAPGQDSYIKPGADVTFALELFNQGTSTAQQITLVDTMPTGFTLSPLDTNGWQTGYRYVRFVAESEAGNRGDWASMAELGILDETGQAIPPNHWRIVYSDSQNGDAPATNAIDNDPNTIWHTKWWGGTDPYPHEVQVDLGARYHLSGFTYLPRPSGANGRVGNYRFYVSEDGTSWIEVTHGSFADSSTLKNVTFTTPAPRQAFHTITDLLVPGATTTVNITLRAGTPLTPATYVNVAEIMAAQDGTHSLLYDRDGTWNANSTDDSQIDDVINNSGGDEDDQDRAAVLVTADVTSRLTKQASATVVNSGDVVTYTVIFTNTSAALLQNITLIDPLPLGTQPVGGSYRTRGATLPAAVYHGNTFSFTAAALLPGGQITLTIPVQTDLGARDGQPITNTAFFTATANSGAVLQRATAGVTAHNPNPNADAAIQKLASTPVLAAGAPLTYTLLVTNVGGAALQNVVITDTLPPAYTLLHAQLGVSGGVQPTITVMARQVTVTVLSLNAGGRIIVTLQGAVAPNLADNTHIENRAYVAALNESNLNNNSSIAGVTIANPLLTPTPTGTSMPTATATPLPTATTTPTATAGATLTATATNLPTIPTATATPLPTATVTPTTTVVATLTATATNLPTIPTATATPLPTVTVAPTTTVVATLTATATAVSPAAADSDFDSVVDALECGGAITCSDTDQDGKTNDKDVDSDGDGIPDQTEAVNQVVAAANGLPVDSDGDGAPDYLDVDSDNDSIADQLEAYDNNDDGHADMLPSGRDSDADGLDDAFDTIAASVLNAENAAGAQPPLPDFDGSLSNWRDSDDDGDGILTQGEAHAMALDVDQDGAANYLDVDADGDGISDQQEAGGDPSTPLDIDNNGTPDYLQPMLALKQLYLPLVSR